MPWTPVAATRYALRGMRFFFEERNARILLAGTVLVVAAGFVFRIQAWEWCAVIAATALLWMAEAMNSALERLTDLVSPGFHPLAGKAKDLAAAAVMLALVAAVSIGLIVFGPRLF
jgi:diacylglycerol kinase (ATP)